MDGRQSHRGPWFGLCRPGAGSREGALDRLGRWCRVRCRFVGRSIDVRRRRELGPQGVDECDRRCRCRGGRGLPHWAITQRSQPPVDHSWRHGKASTRGVRAAVVGAGGEVVPIRSERVSAPQPWSRPGAGFSAQDVEIFDVASPDGNTCRRAGRAQRRVSRGLVGARIASCTCVMSVVSLREDLFASTAQSAVLRAMSFARGALRSTRRTMCALRGHDRFLHFEPNRLSLRCVACGAETPGWRIDVDPRFRGRQRPLTSRRQTDFERSAGHPTLHHVRQKTAPASEAPRAA